MTTHSGQRESSRVSEHWLEEKYEEELRDYFDA